MLFRSGKSYAFETALRYGIPKSLVNEAKILYGEDKEKLNTLIEKSSRLEMKLQNEISKAEEKSAHLEQKIIHLQDKELELEKAFLKSKNELESAYAEAINAAKKAIKEQSPQNIHRQISLANKLLNEARNTNHQEPQNQQETRVFTINERIKYRNHRGIILNLNKNKALIQLEDGIKLQVSTKEIKHYGNLPTPPQTKIQIQTPQNANVVLDLHGLRDRKSVV